jgi:hypothetical protein
MQPGALSGDHYPESSRPTGGLARLARRALATIPAKLHPNRSIQLLSIVLACALGSKIVLSPRLVAPSTLQLRAQHIRIQTSSSLAQTVIKIAIMLSHAHFDLHQLRRQSLEAPVTLPHELWLLVLLPCCPASGYRQACQLHLLGHFGRNPFGSMGSHSRISVHSDAREVLSMRISSAQAALCSFVAWTNSSARFPPLRAFSLY